MIQQMSERDEMVMKALKAYEGGVCYLNYKGQNPTYLGIPIGRGFGEVGDTTYRIDSIDSMAKTTVTTNIRTEQTFTVQFCDITLVDQIVS